MEDHRRSTGNRHVLIERGVPDTDQTSVRQPKPIDALTTNGLVSAPGVREKVSFENGAQDVLGRQEVFTTLNGEYYKGDADHLMTVHQPKDMSSSDGDALVSSSVLDSLTAPPTAGGEAALATRKKNEAMSSAASNHPNDATNVRTKEVSESDIPEHMKSGPSTQLEGYVSEPPTSSQAKVGSPVYLGVTLNPKDSSLGVVDDGHMSITDPAQDDSEVDPGASGRRGMGGPPGDENSARAKGGKHVR